MFRKYQCGLSEQNKKLETRNRRSSPCGAIEARLGSIWRYLEMQRHQDWRADGSQINQTAEHRVI